MNYYVVDCEQNGRRIESTRKVLSLRGEKLLSVGYTSSELEFLLSAENDNPIDTGIFKIGRENIAPSDENSSG